MKQNYHMNANTNAHSRAIIHGAKASNTTLAHRFGVSTKTIAKWKSRDFVKDKTSRPKTIHYALNETEREIIRVVQTLTWLELDDLTDSIVPACQMPIGVMYIALWCVLALTECHKKRNNKPLHLRNMSLDIYTLMLPIYQN